LKGQKNKKFPWWRTVRRPKKVKSRTKMERLTVEKKKKGRKGAGYGSFERGGGGVDGDGLTRSGNQKGFGSNRISEITVKGGKNRKSPKPAWSHNKRGEGFPQGGVGKGKNGFFWEGGTTEPGGGGLNSPNHSQQKRGGRCRVDWRRSC